MDADSVADELYRLLPEEFIAARTAREKEAKAAGDKDLAAQIHRMAKPNQVGWLANQLSRAHAAEITPLLELGADLRDASSNLSGEQLRAFTRQRNQLIGALIQQARRLATAAGKPVNSDTARALQDTLQAALADPTAAERLLAGRLTTGLTHVGFGSDGASGNLSGASAPRAVAQPSKTRATTSKTDRDQEEVQRALAELEDAKTRVEETTDTRDEAKRELGEAEQAVSDAEAKIERLQRKLDKAVGEQSQAQRDVRQARTMVDRAEKAARDAVRRLEAADRRCNTLARNPGG